MNKDKKEVLEYLAKKIKYALDNDVDLETIRITKPINSDKLIVAELIIENQRIVMRKHPCEGEL